MHLVVSPCPGPLVFDGILTPPPPPPPPPPPMACTVAPLRRCRLRLQLRLTSERLLFTSGFPLLPVHCRMGCPLFSLQTHPTTSPLHTITLRGCCLRVWPAVGQQLPAHLVGGHPGLRLSHWCHLSRCGCWLKQCICNHSSYKS